MNTKWGHCLGNSFLWFCVSSAIGSINSEEIEQLHGYRLCGGVFCCGCFAARLQVMSFSLHLPRPRNFPKDTRTSPQLLQCHHLLSEDGYKDNSCFCASYRQLLGVTEWIPIAVTPLSLLLIAFPLNVS